MLSNESYQLTQGGSLVIQATLKDTNGNVVASYDGTQTLLTTMWPGGNQAAAFTPTTTWVTPASGLIQIVVTNAESMGLADGRYQLLTRLLDSGTWVDAYGCTVDVLEVAGTGTALSTYTTFDDLLKYASGWLRQLQDDDQLAGYMEFQHRARRWLDDIAQKHFRVASMVMVVGGNSFGPRISGGRSQWLQEMLDANFLIVTEQIKEACSKYALALICEAQIGIGDSAVAYSRLARMYRSQADYLATCMTLEVDTDGDHFPEIMIDCSCVNSLYG